MIFLLDIDKENCCYRVDDLDPNGVAPEAVYINLGENLVLITREFIDFYHELFLVKDELPDE